MAGGVAGRLDHLDRMAGEVEAVAIADLDVDAGDRVCLVDRAGDGSAETMLQGQIGLDMVAMVMRGEDVGQRPAAAGECV